MSNNANTIIAAMVATLEAITSGTLYQTTGSRATTFRHNEQIRPENPKTWGGASDRMFFFSDMQTEVRPRISDGLDYIQTLGITVLYPDPVIQGLELKKKMQSDANQVRTILEDMDNWQGGQPAGLNLCLFDTMDEESIFTNTRAAVYTIRVFYTEG